MGKLISCGVSVYPDFQDPENKMRIHEYIKKAASLGFDEVFSSLHLPEKDVSESLDEMAALGEFVKSSGMEFTLDLSAKEMKAFQKDPEKTIEDIAGVDIPDGMLDKVVSGVQAKLSGDKLSGALGSIKKMF